MPDIFYRASIFDMSRMNPRGKTKGHSGKTALVPPSPFSTGEGHRDMLQQGTVQGSQCVARLVECCSGIGLAVRGVETVFFQQFIKIRTIPSGNLGRSGDIPLRGPE
jgi:hypothetical protein